MTITGRIDPCKCQEQALGTCYTELGLGDTLWTLSFSDAFYAGVPGLEAN